MKLANFIKSTLKVVASEKVNILNDLIQPDNTKNIEQLLDDQKEKNSKSKDNQTNQR